MIFDAMSISSKRDTHILYTLNFIFIHYILYFTMLDNRGKVLVDAFERLYFYKLMNPMRNYFSFIYFVK